MRKELELYIHIPFCIKKCAYCDFLSGPASDEQKRIYFDALKKEIRSCKEYSEYAVTSIFFGGGTPSVVSGEWILEVMYEIRAVFTVNETAEITIEANPGTVDGQKFACYKRAGINRISFGCQSADNEELKMLGRIHTWEDFLESYRLARDAGFDNINVDLMSALPGQTKQSWEETLRKVIKLGPEHISAYSLIIEEGTPFYEWQDELNLPEEDEERLMYEDTGRILKECGYEQYEISNYAKPGKACEHNIGYWIGREYLGLGLGAASMIAGRRFHNTDDMEVYVRNSNRADCIREEIQILSRDNQMEEFMILGLRMTVGVSEEDFCRRFDVPMESVFGEVINQYCATGHLLKQDGHVRFTEKGISVSNHILADMLL